METFEEIEGAVLEEISSSSDTYVGMNSDATPLEIKGQTLSFDLGRFVIENPFSVTGPENTRLELNNLIGCKVKSAFSNESEVRLIFESGAFISVSVKDEDFTGPEAASFEPRNGPIIVFN